jgi:hypothetical protein
VGARAANLDGIHVSDPLKNANRTVYEDPSMTDAPRPLFDRVIHCDIARVTDAVLAKEPFSALERRAVLGLASLYCLRMLGLFMVLPLFAVYAQELSGSNVASIGLALGAYGLTQAALQVPSGLVVGSGGPQAGHYRGIVFLGAWQCGRRGGLTR